MQRLRLDSSAGDRFLSGTGLAGCALALLGALGDRPVEPPAGAQAIGRLESRVNTVRRRLDGTLVWSSIATGEPVFEKDAVFADDASAARLVLDDGSWIDVGPKTLVVVQRRRAGAEGIGPVSIELVRGSVQAASGEQPIAIRTGEDSVVLAGGSQAGLRSDAKGDASVEVLAGGASVTSRAGSLALSSGERSRIGRAAPKAERSTIALEEPGGGARLVAKGDAERVTFRWRGARKDARLEVARDAFFRKTVHTAKVAGASHALALAPGVYHWRVRDGSGPSGSRMLVIVERVRPVVFRPRVGESVYLPPGKDPAVAFSWTGVPDATGYELEVRGGSGQPIRAEVSRTAWLHEGGLSEGRHCARVRATGSAGWSEATCFQVVAGTRLPPPRLVNP